MKLKNYKIYLLAIFYSLLMYPLVINGYFVNYIYIFLPLISCSNINSALSKYRLNESLTNFLRIYFYIFIFGLITLIFKTIIDSQNIVLILKQSISFITFISIFSLAGYYFSDKKVIALKLGIIFISFILSISSIYTLLTNDFLSYWGNIKAEVGSMRNGVFYLLALSIMHFDNSNNYLQISSYLKIFKKKDFNLFLIILIYTVLYLGILLTISRSAYFSLLILLLIIIFNKLYFSKFTFSFQKSKLRYFFLGLIFISLFIVIVSYILDYTLIENFYNFTTKNALNIPKVISELDEKASSFSQRSIIYINILKHSFSESLIGSSFLGYWHIIDKTSGSAHSQHLEILLKTGFVGFAAYLILLFNTFKKLFTIDKSLFIGLLLTTIFGILNETYRIGGASFIFAVFLSISFYKPKTSNE